MNRNINDDFFEGSSMSFGDHIEELRSCLFKALIWLSVGVCVGLYFGTDVIKWVEAPVQRALVKYYQEKSFQQMKANYQGEWNPEVEEKLRIKAKENEWIAIEVFVVPAELRRVLNFDQTASVQEPIELQPEAEKPDAGDPDEEKPGEDDPNTDEPVTRVAAMEDLIPQGEPTRMLTWQRATTSTEALRVEEVFMIWLKAGIVFGAMIASPGIFWHIWQFIAAGLYPHEKQYVWFFMPFSLALFFGGAALAYFFVFDPVLEFLFSFNLTAGIDPRPRISEWMGFVIMLPLGFGISFQLPLVMLLLNRLGLFTVNAYTSQWRIAIVVIFFLSMLLTPADPISMLLLAVPLTALYFLGIGLCVWLPGSRSPFPEPQP